MASSHEDELRARARRLRERSRKRLLEAAESTLIDDGLVEGAVLDALEAMHVARALDDMAGEATPAPVIDLASRRPR
jgi:hypothetical protein